jgi:hypothetical protein
MAKQVSVEIEVNSSQVDQTVQKLGQLKDLGKGLKIQYDIDGKPIDAVLDKSLNLQKQVKVLTAELRKTKEGTAEFQLLSTKLGDAQDQLAKTTAKSKDLFTSLSMIPGPVGQFFSQLQGGIELLKTFSSFTFKDLSFQFKETANDIADIGKNISGIDNTNLDNTKNSASDLGDTLQETSTQAGGTSTALSNVAKSSNQVVDSTGKVTTAAENAASAATKQGQTIAGLTTAQAANVNATRQATAATNQLVVAEETATVATRTLGMTIKSVLIATGIGIAIVLIGELISVLYNMASAEDDAAEATKRLNSQLESQNLLLDLDAKAAKRRNDETIAGLKARGASEGEIRKQTLKNSYDDYTRAYDAEVQARNTYNKNLGLVDAEGLKALEKNLTDREQATKDAYSAYKVLGLNQKADELKEQQTKNKELEQKNKQHLEKIKQDKKTADDTALTNQREINVLKLTEDRDRQRKELDNQRLGEEDKIKSLEISTTRKGELIAQIEEKYGLKLKDLNKKFKDEDIKANLDFLNKLGDITISSFEDETKREKAARELKYSNDLRDLETDKEFIKLSEETKAEYRRQLREALDNDLNKIELDNKVKGYQDELMLLEAQNKVLVEGTQAYTDNSIAIENKAYQIKLANAKDNATKIEAINAEHAANLKNIDLAAFEAKKQIEIQKYQVVAGIGQSLQQLAGKQKGLAIAGVVVEKAAAIGQIWANNAIANAKATAASPLTFGQPWVTINTVSAVLSTAATVAAAAKSISEINNASSSSSSATAGGEAAAQASPNLGKNYEQGGLIGGRRHAQGGTIIEAEAGEAIMTRGAVTMFQPLLSAMNQMGGGTSFTKGASGQAGYDNPRVTETITQPQIVKTYVVSSDLTNEAQKQARLKDLSTL